MKVAISTILFALCASGTAFAQDVRFNSDPGADFHKYRTYRWAEHPDSKHVDPSTFRQLGDSFDAELAKKGLQKVSSDTPSDLIIVFQLATGQEKLLTTFTNEYGYGPGWRQVWYSTVGGSSSMPAASKMNTGQIVLDMYDTSTRHIVWRGMVNKGLDSDATPEERKKNIGKSAEKLIQLYPPKK